MNPAILSAIIIAIATLIGAGIQLLAKQKERSKNNNVHNRDYFLIGCGLGNRVSIFPLPHNKHNTGALNGLNELIDALQRIGFKKTHPCIKIITTVKKKAHSMTKDIAERYFEAMNNLPKHIRDRSTEEQFKLFKLGQLLYEIAISYEIATSESIVPKTNALEALLPDLPHLNSFRGKIVDFIRKAQSGVERESLLEDANEIAQAIADIL